MTNEMNTARPVGGEALQEAARKALNYIKNNESELGICLDCGDNLRAALASHPTTGQETVATPRAYGTDWAAVVANGLVGKTGDDVAACLRHAHSCGYTEGYGAGKNYEQAKVATPSPAQEPGTGDTGGWRSLKFDDPWDEGLADALQVSTRQLTVQWRGSPQAPTIGWLRDDQGKSCVACSDRMHAAIQAIRTASPTPATTAETRGPAEGGR